MSGRHGRVVRGGEDVLRTPRVAGAFHHVATGSVRANCRLVQPVGEGVGRAGTRAAVEDLDRVMRRCSVPRAASALPIDELGPPLVATIARSDHWVICAVVDLGHFLRGQLDVVKSRTEVVAHHATTEDVGHLGVVRLHRATGSVPAVGVMGWSEKPMFDAAIDDRRCDRYPNPRPGTH